MKRKPRIPEEKAKLVVEGMKGERTLNEIGAEKRIIHPNMLSKWKKEALEGLPTIFENDAAKKRKENKVYESQLEELYAQIGKLTTQNEWLKKLVSERSMPERRLRIDFNNRTLSMSTQASLLYQKRHSLYDRPATLSSENLCLKVQID